MKARKLLCLLLAVALTLGALAACGGGAATDGGGTTPSTDGTTTPSTDGGTDAPVASGGLEHDPYTFTYYFNYDWQAIRPWGEDPISKHWQEKFNITANTSRPDSNPEELLNLRITSNDLPDAIWMERGAVNIRMARMGLFVDLDTLKPMLDNNWYDDNILPQTQEHLKIDGKLYGIPNWARKGPSGGNEGWMVTTDIYKAAGSPTINTFEDMYNYAVAVRDSGYTTSEGLDAIPFISEDGSGTQYGSQLIRAIYRSMGSPTTASETMYGRVGSTYQFILRDPVYRDAVMEAAKWYREGLARPTNLTDSREEFLEKLSTGRGGLIWYDHSQDDANNFRKIVRTNYPGNSVELISFESGGKTYLYPPARGLAPERIYADHYGTVGWNVTCITTAAEKPARIFELISYWLTKEGSVEMMYGPAGGFFWDEKDANGNPILKAGPDDHPEESQEYALWYWQFAGHADNVDSTKFAANDALPEAQRSWVISSQAHLFTPLMAPLTDEYIMIGEQVEPDTPLAVQRTLCEDQLRAIIPQILLSANEDEANRLYDELVAFCDANGMADIEAVYDVKYQDNLAKQNGTIFTK